MDLATNKGSIRLLARLPPDSKMLFLYPISRRTPWVSHRIPVPYFNKYMKSRRSESLLSIICEKCECVTNLSKISVLKVASHDGRVYWYNTLFFTKADVARMPYFETKKLARRATNYLLLGLSLPNVLDLNNTNPLEYLRSLNALLAEFESYQHARPFDGNPSSSLSRAKIPQMFKRAAHGGTKGRRSSAAAEIGLPIAQNDYGDGKQGSNSGNLGPSTNLTFATGDQDLMPGEEYSYLLTPTLPFDPDYFETFATLCDILIDCYTRVTALISSPSAVTTGTAEVFAKADARVRKILVAPVVKEFEDASRQGIRTEFGGLGKVLVGGLV